MVKTYVEKVTNELYLLRVDDEKTRYFEALWEIPEGITYNSYVLVDSKVVLFDSWKNIYTDKFIETLRKVVDPKDIDYIVIHHTEPDHSGAIPRVLELNGNRAEVWGHPLARSMLESFYGITVKFRSLKDGEEIQVGNKKLKFVFTPWLHWPDTIITLIVDDSVLLTCDPFGGFSIPTTIFDDDEEVVNNYMKYVSKYVITIVGNYRDYIIKAVDKLKSLNITPKIIAPAHGLIFKNRPDSIINHYIKLAKGTPQKNKVIVLYSSMYGFVEKAVKIAINELAIQGIRPLVFKFTDVERSDIGEVVSEINNADAVIIGTATYEADVFPYMNYILDILTKKVKLAKPVLILTSCGWGPVAGARASEKLKKAGYRVIDVIDFRGQPKGSDIDRIRNGVRLLIKDMETESNH